MCLMYCSDFGCQCLEHIGGDAKTRRRDATRRGKWKQERLKKPEPIWVLIKQLQPSLRANSARLLSESKIGQGGLRRGYSEEEEGEKGKKEEEVRREFTTPSLGTALRPRLARTWRNCRQGGQDMFETPSFCNKTGRVALRERDSEREGGEWYHADSVGIEESCTRAS
ncbi:hypothetical protein B0H13DRAFT_2278791 [Mycena leptocephala]|nr:hypothetical protein B0H13DRAFT_2278791 [Mycena leptocephala]